MGTLASQATSRKLYEASIAEKHEQWMEQFGRVYQDSAEKERRFTIFKNKVEFVEKFNCEGNKTYKLSINEFADVSREEFLRHHTGYKIPATLSNGGIASEENYQYQAINGTCDTTMANQHAAQITGYEDVPANSESDLLKAVSMQPVSAGIEAYGQAFSFYSSGVFSGPCGTDLDHAVTIIGYGTTENGTDYWLIKNSWGESWGEKGYMRILRNADNPEGLCGLAMQASYPTA